MSSKSNSPYLSIIIVNYNTFGLTLQTVESVEAEIKQNRDLFSKYPLEIVVVDNQSPDGSGTKLVRESRGGRRFIFVQAPSNGGFAQGNLFGFQESRGEVIMLLNSDTLVLPGSLTNLIKLLAAKTDLKNNIGVLACELRDHDDGALQPQGGDRPSLLSIASQMLFLDDLPLVGRYLPTLQHTGRRADQKPTNSDLTYLGWVGGTAMVFRRDLIAKTGFLDTNIFMYGEDIEFCYRVYKKTRRQVAIYHSSPIVHYGSASSSSKNALLGEIKGDIYLWWQQFPAWQMPLLRLLLFLGSALRFLIYKFFKKDTTRRDIYAEALKLAWTYRPNFDIV